MNPIVTSPPAIQPVTLADIKDQLNIETADSDTRLSILIAAATQMVEDHIGRALITRSYMATLNWWPTSNAGFVLRFIRLPKPPLISIESLVTYDDSDAPTTYPTSQYFVDTTQAAGRLVLRRGCVWPLPLRVSSAIELRWTAGYGATADEIPPPILLAIRLQVGVLNEARGDETSAAALHPAAVALLSPYLVWS